MNYAACEIFMIRSRTKAIHALVWLPNGSQRAVEL